MSCVADQDITQSRIVNSLAFFAASDMLAAVISTAVIYHHVHGILTVTHGR